MQHSDNSRILLIDNYSDSSQLIDMLLYIKKCKYDFFTANAPSKALELIAAERFDLYILEYKLPEMNGIELCRQIRQADKKTPILFFNKKERAFDREISMAAGANEFLLKPSNLEKIAEMIGLLLGKNKQNYAAVSSPARSKTDYSLKPLSPNC
jgi:DNA-binding response OmpR family regulator